jgi:tyrosyl-tRNA synthetase
MIRTPEQQLEIIKRGTVEIYSEKELLERLKTCAAQGRPMRVKLGVDPTTPDIHLGHTVVLRKLRQIQDLGHVAVLIIGDFTGMIGDPSGREKARAQLTREQVEANAKTYVDQVRKVLDMDKIELVRNSEWLAPLKFADILRIASKLTVARILERDDFMNRYKGGTPIGLHEFMYPLMQGFDSVAVRADIELGGSDQLFNLLVGRQLQKEEGQPAQIVMTMPLLVGTDGTEKMSKSLGNYIGVSDEPQEMFGKAMSIPDALMKDYFTLVTNYEMAEIEKFVSPATHPRDAKVALAKRLVEIFHGAEQGAAAQQHFEQTFSKREVPDEMPEFRLAAGDMKDGKVWLAKLLVTMNLAPSTSEAKRLIGQGAVLMDGERVTDQNLNIQPKDGMVLCVGKKKRYGKLRV